MKMLRCFPPPLMLSFPGFPGNNREVICPDKNDKESIIGEDEGGKEKSMRRK